MYLISCKCCCFLELGNSKPSISARNFVTQCFCFPHKFPNQHPPLRPVSMAKGRKHSWQKCFTLIESIGYLSVYTSASASVSVRISHTQLLLQVWSDLVFVVADCPGIRSRAKKAGPKWIRLCVQHQLLPVHTIRMPNETLIRNTIKLRQEYCKYYVPAKTLELLLFDTSS